jgi:hypothetical protein
MADQPIHYLGLLDDIASIDPSKDRAKELARLWEEHVRQVDPLDLLLLAEQAVYMGQWQAAAQLFSQMMFSLFSKRYSNADLVEHAKRIILLTTGHATELRSPTDLLLYGHRRLTVVLHKDGIQQPYLDEWIVSALSQLLRNSKDQTRDSIEDRIREIKGAMAALQSGNDQINKGLRREIGATRKLLSCSLTLGDKNDAWIGISDKGFWHLLWLGLEVVLIAILAFGFGHLFPLPVSAVLDRSWPGSLLRAAIFAWPLLLIATWRFAFSESKRTHTYQYISPIYLLNRGKFIAGQIVPFSRDWFFHIFQFVWIALLVIAGLLFRKYQGLPSVWNSSTIPLPWHFGATILLH